MTKPLPKRRPIYELRARLSAMPASATAGFLRTMAAKIERGEHTGPGWYAKKRRTRCLDWEELKRLFVGAGRMSLVKFSIKHSVDYGYLRNRAAEEGWIKLRREVQGGAATDEGVALCDCCKKAITDRRSVCFPV